MKLFASKLAVRLTIAKTLGFVFWLLGFILLPLLLNEPSIIFRLAILFWYTTLGGFLWIFGLINKHPSFTNWKFPFWFRWIFLWAWMNFVLVLFIYDRLNIMILWTVFEWFSPYRLILEWAAIWLIIEYFATKFWWEGKKLIK